LVNTLVLFENEIDTIKTTETAAVAPKQLQRKQLKTLNLIKYLYLKP
jgi:hypothetical protein